MADAFEGAVEETVCAGAGVAARAGAQTGAGAGPFVRPIRTLKFLM